MEGVLVDEDDYAVSLDLLSLIIIIILVFIFDEEEQQILKKNKWFIENPYSAKILDNKTLWS